MENDTKENRTPDHSSAEQNIFTGKWPFSSNLHEGKEATNSK